MSKVPDLVPVHVLARDAGLSSMAMRRRLLRLEHSLKRKILHKGEGRSCPWLADRSFLSKMAGNGGRSTWDRMRDLERAMTDLLGEVADLRVEIAYCRQQLVEAGFGG